MGIFYRHHRKLIIVSGDWNLVLSIVFVGTKCIPIAPYDITIKRSAEDINVVQPV